MKLECKCVVGMMCIWTVEVALDGCKWFLEILVFFIDNIFYRIRIAIHEILNIFFNCRRPLSYSTTFR